MALDDDITRRGFLGAVIGGAAAALGLSKVGCDTEPIVIHRFHNRPPLTHIVNSTNAQGDISFNGVPFHVQDEAGNPLGGITLHYLIEPFAEGVDRHYMVLAVDPHGKHYPTKIGGESEEIVQEPGMKKSALAEAIVLTMALAKQAYGIVKIASQDERHLMTKEENVNVYCMSAEQFRKSTVEIPAGIVAEVLGGDLDWIMNAIKTPLSIIANYIAKDGKPDQGYMVAEPKTALTLCGEDFEGMVCNLAEQDVVDQLWQKSNVPYWEIRGSCELPQVSLEEVCDGVDNNGNGKIDEGNICGTGCEETCTEPGYDFCEEFSGDLCKWDVGESDAYTVNGALLLGKGRYVFSKQDLARENFTAEVKAEATNATLLLQFGNLRVYYSPAHDQMHIACDIDDLKTFGLETGLTHEITAEKNGSLAQVFVNDSYVGQAHCPEFTTRKVMLMGLEQGEAIVDYVKIK